MNGLEYQSCLQHPHVIVLSCQTQTVSKMYHMHKKSNIMVIKPLLVQ